MVHIIPFALLSVFANFIIVDLNKSLSNTINNALLMNLLQLNEKFCGNAALDNATSFLLESDENLFPMPCCTPCSCDPDFTRLRGCCPVRLIQTRDVPEKQTSDILSPTRHQASLSGTYARNISQIEQIDRGNEDNTLLFIWNVQLRISLHINGLIRLYVLHVTNPIFIRIPKSEHMSHTIRKRTFWHVRSTKTQIRLRIRAVWSEASLSACKNVSLPIQTASRQRRLTRVYRRLNRVCYSFINLSHISRLSNVVYTMSH